MNVQFIECIATPAFGDLYVFISLWPKRFFLSLLNISVTKREKKIVEELSKERKANKEREKQKQKQQQKQNTKSQTPKTSHIVRKIINREREKKNNTET